MSSIDRLDAATPANGDQFQYGPSYLRELKTHLNTMKWEGYQLPYLENSGAAVNGTAFFNGWFALLAKTAPTTWNIMGVDTATGNVKAYTLTLAGIVHLSTLGEANIVNSRGVFRIDATTIGVYTDSALYIVGYAANATTILHTHALAGSVRSICRTGVANQVAVSTTTDFSILTFASGFAAPFVTEDSYIFNFANDRHIVLMGTVPGTGKTRIGVIANHFSLSHNGYFEWDGAALSAPVNVYDTSAIAPFYALMGVMPAGTSTAWIFHRFAPSAFGTSIRMFEDIGVVGITQDIDQGGGYGTLCMLTDGYVLNPSDLTIQLYEVKYRLSYQDGLADSGYI